MKQHYKTIKGTLLLTALFIFTASNLFAHFGSKGPFGGSVTCGTSDSASVYLGTAAGGVYQSSSGLLSWSPRLVGLYSGKITALAHSGRYLFAGTADSGVYIFNGYIGTDRHWKRINNGLTNIKITSLLAIDSITLLAGTKGGGIFKTTDKGANWALLKSPALHHFDITVLVKAKSRIIHASDGGIYASDDKGASWIGFNDINTDDEKATSLSYNTVTDQILIANSVGLYLASSASTTTTPAYSSAQTSLPANTIIRSISNNGTTWFLATDKGVFSSPANAISWTAVNTGLPTLNVTTIVPFKTDLVAGTISEGIVKSPANVISWIANNTGFNNLATYSLITNGAALVIAATEKGVFVSTDLATTYKNANKGLTDSLNVTDLTLAGSKLYATTKNAGVFVSADTGKTWSTFNTGLSNLNIKKVYASSSKLYLYDSNGNIFQSAGTSWVSIQSGLPGSVKPSSLAFFGSNILLGTYGNGIYIRDEAGSSWTQSNTGLLNLKVTSVTANKTNIFAGTEGAGVFVSDQVNISWKATSPTSIPFTTTIGLDGTKIEALAYYEGYVCASFKGELLVTIDNGNSWVAAGNQFNLPSYSHINKISFTTTRVFVTTENNTLYSNALSEFPTIPSSIKEDNFENKPGSFSVSPNPTNGNFNLDLKNIKGDVKEIKVFDSIGKLVKTISGSNVLQLTVAVDARAGLYHIQVYTSKGTVTQKIIIQ